METWLVSLLSVIGSAIVTSIVSIVISRIINRQFKKKDEAQEAFEKQKEEDRKTEIDLIIKQQIEPFKKHLKELDSAIASIENGILSGLRNDILNCYYRCLDKGYRNDYDTINMNDMFEAYTGLHGNSFIGDIMERFKSLPTKEESRNISKKENNQKVTKE